MPPGERRVRAHHRFRLHADMLRDCEQQRLVGGDVVEHAGEEARIGRGFPDPVGADPCKTEEPAEPLFVLGEEPKRLNREIFPEFPLVRAAFRHRRLPFRNVSPLGFY